MNTATTRKRSQPKTWPKSVQPGRAIVKVYRRTTPAGNFSFMVANYADGERRRFDSYPTEVEAIEAATKLAQRLDSRDYVAASMTREQAIEFANASARLKPFNVTVDAATATVAECLKVVGDLVNLHSAVKFYRQRHKQVVKKSVPDLVAEFLELKKSRGASPRYLKDLRWRLESFAADCTKEAGNVTTADIQDWLDGFKLAPQNYRNFRTVLNTLFEHARARSYCFDNPVESVEKIKVPNGGSIAIFSPNEIAKLLNAASADFLPIVALGAFAGLRTAEIERLEWRNIDLMGGFIHVSADKAKTASRRLVPVQANLAAWLSPYANHTGRVWQGTTNDLQHARAILVKAAGVPWKGNGARHSYISYRLAEIQDAAKVALEAGNSPNIVFKHYRELVKPTDAVKWFDVKPEQPMNGNGSTTAPVVSRAREISIGSGVERVREILDLTGPAILLPIPAGQKKPDFDDWQKMGEAQMRDPAYIARLNNGCNIGVLLGKPSGNLCSIDLDDEQFIAPFLEANPKLVATLQTKRLRGCNFWIRITGGCPPLKILHHARLKNSKGKPLQIGEWRSTGGQTVIDGEVDRLKYQRLVESKPVNISFSEIKWPEWIADPPTLAPAKIAPTALPAITEADFRKRYFAIDAKSYGSSPTDEDFGYTWEWFQGVRELYTRAAQAGRFVLFTADQ